MGRRIALEDLYRLRVVSDPQISPDGALVAFVITQPVADTDSYRSSIFLAAADGSEIVQLTRGARDSAPRWSPDGTQLAFLSARGAEGARPQLHLLPASGGEARAITQVDRGVGGFVWSPDGRRIAFLSATFLDGPPPKGGDHRPVVVTRMGYKADGAGLTRDRRTHVFVMDVDGAGSQQLTSGDWSAGLPCWSPDGATLVFAAATQPDRDLRPGTSLHAVPAAGGVPRQLIEEWGSASAPTWTPDGTSIVFAGAARMGPGHTRLWRIPFGGGAPEPLTASFDRNLMVGGPGYPGAPPQVTPDGSAVVFCARDRGCTHVFRVDLAGGEPEKILGGRVRVISGVTLARGADADRMAFAASTPHNHGEVMTARLDGRAQRCLTEIAADDLDGIDLFTAQERTFTAPDGTELHGFVIRGTGDGPSPTLLDVHGGPHNMWSATFDSSHLFHQTLAQAGWNIVLVNSRGSDGYGQDFYTALTGGWGERDTGDFMAALDALVAEGIADPERLAVHGYSYGGYMTNWLTSHTGRFAAAISGGCISDLESFFGESDAGRGLNVFEIGAEPHADPDVTRRLSPLTYVNEVATPTLILHGERDDRCPIGQAEEWFAALRSRRVPVELVRYPGASHLFILNGRPSHRIDYARRLHDWSVTHSVRSGRPTARSRRDRWQRSLEELAGRHRVPGVSMAVIDAGEVVELCTGVLGNREGRPVTPDAVFQIGSITKVFTATMTMQLVEAGLVDLDALVTTYLPDFRLKDGDAHEQITVRHLLTHTSGIPGDYLEPFGQNDDAIERYVESLKDIQLVHPVGAMWSYCNSGYVLAGRVIEAVTGRAWREALAERLLSKLGISTMLTRPEQIVMHPHAIGHDALGAPVPPRWDTDPFGLPAGSLPVAAMQQPHVAVPGLDQVEQGLGWAVLSWDGGRVIGHGGGTAGQNSLLRAVPDAGVAVAVLCNGPTGPAVSQHIVGEVLADIAGVRPPTPGESSKPPPDLDLTRYEGRFESVSMRITVAVQEGSLRARMEPLGRFAAEANELPALTLRAVDEQHFAAGAATFTFLDFDADGRPAYLHAGRVARRVD